MKNGTPHVDLCGTCCPRGRDVAAINQDRWPTQLVGSTRTVLGYLPPAEYGPRATYKLGWPAILVNGGYVSAPRATSAAKVNMGRSVFHCPSASPSASSPSFMGPTSRTDPEGGMAFAFPDETATPKIWIDCWYAINGVTGNPNKWPFTRVPLDGGGGVVLHKIDIVRNSSK